MARPGIIQQCFQGEARGPYEVVYFCLACETHRTMKPESIQGHKKLESHIASFAHWSARRDKEASESVGLKDDSVQDKSISESHSTGHPGNNTLKRTDQIDQLESEDVKRRRTLDNLNSRSPFPKITPPISRRSLYRTSSLRKPSSPSNTGETSGKAQETALVEGQSKLHDQASGQQGQTEEPSNQAATATSAPDQSSTPHRESSFSLDFEGTDGIDSDLEDHHEIDSSTDDGLAGVPLPPRYTPTASSRLASTHDNESRLRIFNQIANATGLDEHHLELGRRLCDVTGPEFQFMMSMITSLSTRQEILSYHDDITRQISEIRGGSNGIPTSNGWVESLELREFVRQIAFQCILGSDLQVYSVTVDQEGDQDRLPISFSTKVMNVILSKPVEWRNRLLPARYGKDPNPKDVNSFHKMFRTVLVEVRTEFDEIIFINLPITKPDPRSSTLNVPVLDTIIVKLYEKEHGYIGGRVRSRREILKDVDHFRRARYAWLRMQAIHWSLNHQSYDKQVYRSVVNQALDGLRKKSKRYRSAYYILVLQSDFARIDGTKTFDRLKGLTDFALPTEAAVLNTMAILDNQVEHEFVTD